MHNSLQLKSNQQGAVLLITIVFLLIVTGIVITSLGSKTLQTNLISSFQRAEIGYQEARSNLSQLFSTQQTAIKTNTNSAIATLMANCTKNAITLLTADKVNTAQIGTNTNKSSIKFLGERLVTPNNNESTGSLRVDAGTSGDIELVFDLSTKATLNNTDGKISSTQHQGISWKIFDICTNNQAAI
jgi:Tfp pilus assembly protein PilX